MLRPGRQRSTDETLDKFPTHRSCWQHRSASLFQIVGFSLPFGLRRRSPDSDPIPERTSSGTPLGPNLSAAIFPELTSESSAAQSERGHRVRAEVLHIGWQLTHQCRGAGETQRSIFSPRRNRRSAGSHKVAVNKVWICPATRAPKPASHTRAEKLGGQDQHRQRRDPCRKAEHQQRRADDLDRLP